MLKLLPITRNTRSPSSRPRPFFAPCPFEVFYDPDHSIEEDRFIAIGCSSQGRTLLVVHMENSSGKVVRIISARKATKKEMNAAFKEVL